MTAITEDESECRSKFEDLCRELNMDKETEELAWKKYKETSQRFSLDGDQLHWFCCALYAECRRSYTPTVGGSDNVVVGNCVPLYKLLCSCKISMCEFFEKIKRWHDMAKLPLQFLNHIKRLESSYGIDFTLFQHFITIMGHLYLIPLNEKKNTKYRGIAKCSSNKLYEFVWYFYLCAKNENPSSTVDLVTSYNLLICCIDLIYQNMLAQNRADLINPKFEGVPEKWNTQEFDTSLPTNNVLEALCRLTDTLPNDVGALKRNTFHLVIQEFFRTQTIFGNKDTFMDITSNQNFDKNLKSLSSAYEQYVLSVGDFDSRILLSNLNYRRVNALSESERTTQQQEMRYLVPYTPYTRKNSLPSKDSVSEPIANATNNVRKLQDIAHITSPSDFIRQAGDEIMSKIRDKLTCMSEQFYAKFPNQEEATNRFKLATSLYFYLLDKIIRVEIRTKPNVDIKVLLNTDTFITTLIACCVEIVLDAYGSQVKFPWVLNSFSIMAYQFYKIIEIVVGRHEGILTRELIKHLNAIEETCLESLVWQKSSMLWDVIASSNRSSLPTWSDVDVKRRVPQLQSPMNSAYETFSYTAGSDSARRDLFNTAAERTSSENLTENAESNNKRSGSLPLFLRKVYQLSWLRIKELCIELCMDNETHLNKIWTLFEYSITHNYELMQDRHLDQILMCAIYLYIKVGEIPGKQFADIMKFYRKQPQATSSTYREVLISSENDKKEFQDLIYFYNNIYVKPMTNFGMKFSEKKRSADDLRLSPHPTGKNTAPRKVSSTSQVYVRPMEKNEVLHSPNHLTYLFSKSPSKQLQAMSAIVSKRVINFDGSESSAIPKRTRTTPLHYSKLQGVIKDRQE